ncbi:MAG TPA: NYN domain-containing protein, partial [Frankiaceae bacterium]|nr:NYN domain-containing protein [Frankiaceae bacterium]
VTCVFAATAVTSRPVAAAAAPRGVRVVFSQPGQLADEEIVRLVRAEPPGRPVAVVTSDREVADTVRRAGARAVPSAALLARLDRG